MANDIERLEKTIQKEVFLKDYKGEDRVVYAEDKRKQLAEENKNKPAFRAITGLPSLDQCTDGFRKQQLVVVSGPPKAGKTALTASFTASFMKQGKRCVWFPFEGMYEELFARFPDVLDFHLPNRMERGRIEWMEDRIVEAKQKYGTEIVFIDNLDFLCDPKAVREMKGIAANYSTYVGSVVQEIKELAVAHDMLIFLMSHITKNKWTSDALPTAEDLRDTGKTAQLADVVMMIARKRATIGSEIYAGTYATIGVIENRLNGKTRKIDVQLTENGFIETDNRYSNETGNDRNNEWHF